MTPAEGDLVMMTNRARYRNVVHQLARVKEPPAVYVYVMACGVATTEVGPEEEGAKRCGRCWPATRRET